MSLLSADVLTLLFFLRNGGSVSQVMLIYALQGVILVAFYYKRIRKSHEISETLGKNKKGTTIMRIINYRTANEQFFYLFAIALPVLICACFVLAGIYGDITYSQNEHSNIRVTIGSNDINYISVILVLTIFLVHHYYSYQLSLKIIKQQTARWQGYSLVPYNKIAIRLVVTYFIAVISIPLFVNFGADILFIFFLLLKTVVEIVVSGTFQLLTQKSN